MMGLQVIQWNSSIGLLHSETKSKGVQMSALHAHHLTTDEAASNIMELLYRVAA